MSTPGPRNKTSGDAVDTYGVARCVQLYDAASAPVAPAVAALLDSFEQAFLNSADLSVGKAEDEAPTKEESQFLDIGCGSGSFTRKHLLPRLPSWCKRLVAVDNSEAMLKFAAENRGYPRIEYRKLDILADEDVTRFVQVEGHFQRVYSFLAFHWIAEHRRALTNVETLLAPGGECFLIFSDCLVVFDVFTAMMESPRWEKYSDILLRVLPETRSLEDIDSLRLYLVNLVRATNLAPLACEVFRVTGELGLSKENALDFYTILNPVYQLLIEDEKAELRKFTEDILQDVSKRRSGRPVKAHNLLVIHAQKPRTQTSASQAARAGSK
ncbi:juvenile hormone acid O-methyltransferase-like [Dermacentor andersoni]|uniref:juvenile hormone acid O-methyltransferase-like n=1 Tax=Dermacentor andersoni TaxID=34620 RepID=UPI002155E08E|nr:juvenile hormone acid O-methyltransferase-like [Dermacentor andersoni]